jgi:hypothetical protein
MTSAFLGAGGWAGGSPGIRSDSSVSKVGPMCQISDKGDGGGGGQQQQPSTFTVTVTLKGTSP